MSETEIFHLEASPAHTLLKGADPLNYFCIN